MSDDEIVQEPHKLNTKIVLIVGLGAAAVAILGLWLVGNRSSPDTATETRQVERSDSRQPDPVNANNGAGGNAPSQSGTGEGSSNSIIGQ